MKHINNTISFLNFRFRWVWAFVGEVGVRFGLNEGFRWWEGQIVNFHLIFCFFFFVASRLFLLSGWWTSLRGANLFWRIFDGRTFGTCWRGVWRFICRIYYHMFEVFTFIGHFYSRRWRAQLSMLDFAWIIRSRPRVGLMFRVLKLGTRYGWNRRQK